MVELREALLAAVASGRLDDLRFAMELNEMLPDVGQTCGEDPMTALRRQSADGTGRDVLDALGRLLATPPARLHLGRDAENTAIYVWPGLSERDPATLSAEERAALVALVGAETAAAIAAAKRWTWWRLAIGADGIWHALVRAPSPP